MTPKEFRHIRRDVLRMSQRQLSQTMHRRPESISRVENGRLRISRKMAQKLLDLAGLHLCPTCGQPLP